ncbi:15748_t:CDS:2 [Cetraspora pellucida]|uniref:15748_t:CDS:1 n=1 Tax=Cetraspora pellucida TaxID=1433469 RepID=A0ACA9LXA6_9GLOM|nr:15748_t:CDS:2 [Cetraspora pellucida]
MTKEKQKQNNDSNNTDIETEFMNSNNSKTGHSQTGVWKCFNRDQLHYSYTIEITFKIIMNIAETVFKKFEKIITDDDDTEMLSPAKDLYSNEQDLDLSILTFININSSVFTFSKNGYENKNFNEIESDNDIQDKYDVDEIIAAQLDHDLH